MSAESGADKLLTLAEVCEFLNMSRRTVERLIAAGELLAVRIGRAVRVRLSDLRAFLKRCEVGASS